MASCYAYLLRTKAPRIIPNPSLSLILYISSHLSNSKYILHPSISHYLNCYSLSVQDTTISLGYFHRLLIIFSVTLIFSPSPRDPSAHYIVCFFLNYKSDPTTLVLKILQLPTETLKHPKLFNIICKVLQKLPFACVTLLIS